MAGAVTAAGGAVTAAEGAVTAAGGVVTAAWLVRAWGQAAMDEGKWQSPGAGRRDRCRDVSPQGQGRAPVFCQPPQQGQCPLCSRRHLVVAVHRGPGDMLPAAHVEPPHAARAAPRGTPGSPHLLLMWSHVAVEVGVWVLVQLGGGKGAGVAPALGAQVGGDGCAREGEQTAGRHCSGANPTRQQQFNQGSAGANACRRMAEKLKEGLLKQE